MVTNVLMLMLGGHNKCPVSLKVSDTFYDHTHTHTHTHTHAHTHTHTHTHTHLLADRV